jgi:hypothetical protein
MDNVRIKTQAGKSRHAVSLQTVNTGAVYIGQPDTRALQISTDLETIRDLERILQISTD